MSGRKLIPAAHASEAALPSELVSKTKAYQRAARAENTRRAYKRAWDSFTAWCEANGRQALPAGPDTVAAWITALADSGTGAGRKPLARASINQAISAVVLAHHTAGHPLDRKHPVIAETWRGISRTKARTETIRQARPILPIELQALLVDLRPGALPADARDALLLTLGWAAALRRSELIGLDWRKLGTGIGFVVKDDRGLVVTLAASKASQTEAETVVVPCGDMPAACAALEQWVKVAGLRPGQPLFMPIDKGQSIGKCRGKATERLTDRSVANIIKTRIRALARAKGKTAAEAEDLARHFSGHSMRAGYCTAAAAKDVPSYRIQGHTRHKSADMVAKYVREADKWHKSGLKGVGF